MRLSRAALLFAAISSPVCAQGWDVAELNKTIEETNFVVNRGCSGTLIDIKNRYVLTAEHCIDNQYETITRERIKDDDTVVSEKIRRVLPGQVEQLTFNDDQLQVRSVSYRTKIVATDKQKDLALVQILAPIPNTRAAVISCADPVRGQTVYAVGNPKGFLYASVTRGIVSSVQRTYPMFGIADQADNQLTQISAPIVGGNSGGALYNDKGEFVGVPIMGYPQNESVGFAVPLVDVKRFLRRVGLENDLWATRCEAQAAH